MTRPVFTDRESIRRHQLGRLRRLWEAIRHDNAFYARRLEEADLNDPPASLGEFIEKMPLLDKTAVAEDQRRHPPYGTNLTYPLARYSRYNQTSATTGRPIRWLDTRDDWQWMVENWKEVYRAAGVGAEDRLYFAFSFGPFLGFWTAFDAATQGECLSIPGGGLGSLARLEAIRANRVTVLLCTPTYALRLAEVARAEGIDMGEVPLRRIIVAGEPGGSVPEVRRAIESRWPGAGVFDHHGMTEVGPVSYQCPQRPGTLMVIEAAYLAEIIDPRTRQPVPPGEVGELVLTTLGRLGSPLIRYRTGDLVRQDLEVAQQHGRPEMALAGGILGRVDRMVQVRGVNVYPSAVESVIRAFAEVVEYRVDVSRRDAMTELTVTVEPAPGTADRAALAERIASRMRTTFHLRVPVQLAEPGSLPRFEMKAQRWVWHD